MCCFWPTYVQSKDLVDVFSYVTPIRTRRRPNINTQDPGEPNEPFGLVPHPVLLLLLSFSWTTFSSPLPPSSLFLLFLYTHPLLAQLFLLSSLSLFPYLLPDILLLLFSHIWQCLVKNPPPFTQVLPLLVLFILSYSLVNPLPRHRQPRLQRHIPEM